MRRIYVLSWMLFIAIQLPAQYSIKGRINPHPAYGRTLYLSIINSLDDLYNSSPSFIINSTRVDTLGNFELSGNDLLDEDRFYRLYLSPDNTDSYLFRGGEDENFIHLVLNNSSHLSIHASPSGGRIFQDYQIEGSPESKEIAKFYQLLNSLDKLAENGINTRAKRQLIHTKVNAEIIKFSQEIPFALVRLLAVSHLDLDDISADTDQFLRSFLEDLPKNESNTDYYKAFLVKKLTSSLDSLSAQEPPKVNQAEVTTLYILLGVSFLIIVYLLFLLWKKDKAPHHILAKALDQLSPKEKQVLQLLFEEKSNKEIAYELHVEVTTVKSHIQSIYKKLKIKNRKEVHRFKE